jgi:AcrR family transcriptional regulator
MTRKGQATRDRIVEAAARLMQENGVAGTSLDEVEAEASVGRSQIYHYFSGKEDLVGAVIEYQASGIITSPFTAGGLSSWDGWERWRRETIEHTAVNDCAGGCPLGSLASELADTSESARESLSASFVQWEHGFRDGLTDMKVQGLLSPSADPARLAVMIITSLEGGLLMSQTHRDTKYLEIALDGAMSQVRTAAASGATE